MLTQQCWEPIKPLAAKIMLAVIKLLLLLTATVRLSAAQGEGGCSLAPFWLFADPDDVRSIFQSITCEF